MLAPRLAAPLLALWLQAGAAHRPELPPADLARLDSLGALARSDPEARRALLQAMRGGTPEVGGYAALQLSRAGPPALGLLLGTLRDEDPGVRRLAAYAIGEQGPPARRAVPQLTVVLGGADDSAAAMANWAIMQIARRGGGAMVVALSDLRFGEAGDRAAAAMFLRTMPGTARVALPALLRLLGDSDAGVAEIAAVTLRGLGWVVLDPLQEILRRGEPVTRARALILITRLRAGPF